MSHDNTESKHEKTTIEHDEDIQLLIEYLEDPDFGPIYPTDPENMPCGYVNPQMLLWISQYIGKCDAVDPFAGSGYLEDVLKKCLSWNVRSSDKNGWSAYDDDFDDDDENKTTVMAGDARTAVSTGTETCLLFMFPPPCSKVPFETLQMAMKRGGFKFLVIIQDTLEADHCGNVDYVELINTFNLIECPYVQRHAVMPGWAFTSSVWIGRFPDNQ
jgi:hypothetical protein